MRETCIREKSREVGDYANDLLVLFMNGDPATMSVVSKAKESSLIACDILIKETGAGYFYRVKEYLEGLTNIK
mgnify:CR=1 FL=1|tara:strand:+ start:225 stop:443 length:219 start_codon:yes stop_codon:yes gene_type:complete